MGTETGAPRSHGASALRGGRPKGNDDPAEPPTPPPAPGSTPRLTLLFDLTPPDAGPAPVERQYPLARGGGM